MKTQILTGCVAAAAALTLAGCGSGTKTDKSADSKPQQTTTAASSTAPTTTAAAPTTTAPPTTAAPTTTPPAPAPTTRAPAPPPAPTASSHPVLGNKGDPRCHTSGLSAALRVSGAAAGNRYATITLTNTSGRACRIYGYGGVALIGAPSRQQRDVSAAAVLNSLPAGGHASAQLHWGAVPGTGDRQTGQCEPTPKGMLVTPPDETTSLRVAWPGGPVCERGLLMQGAYRVG